MTGHEHPAPAGHATDAQRQLRQIADLDDEYAEPDGNADLMILLFQIRMVLGDDPADAGRRISRRPTPPN